MLIFNWVVTDIGQHDYSVFVISQICSMLVNIFYCLIKSISNCRATWFKILIDRLSNLLFVKLGYIFAFNNCSGCVVEYYKGEYIIFLEFFEEHKNGFSCKHQPRFMVILVLVVEWGIHGSRYVEYDACINVSGPGHPILDTL